MEVKRIHVLKVPVDIVPLEMMEEKLFSMVEEPGTKQIVFLSVWDLLKARRNAEYLSCLESASLILPVSKSIIKGACFLKRSVPVRYNPFDAVVQFLSILETRYRSLYLLGAHKGSLMKAEKNVRQTFPSLQIVGRYVGYYPKSVEKDVLTAIFKANPTMVLLGDGVKDDIRWAYRRRNNFGSSIFVYYKDSLGIFSNRKRRVSSKAFEKGHEKWIEILHNPLKIFRLFPFIRYVLLLWIYRILKR